MTAVLPSRDQPSADNPSSSNPPASSSPIPSNLNGIIMGGLAVIAIVILALSLSGTNKTVATIVQAGLVIAIIGVLLRDAGNQNILFGQNGAVTRLTQMAIGTSGK